MPLNIVKKNLLPSIEAHFAEHSLNEYYRKALDELDLNPINQAQINKLHFHEGCDLEFVAESEVTPVVKLPKYDKKFKIKTTRYIASTDDIDAANWFRLARYEGRNSRIPHNSIDDIEILGWNFYMPPEQAARGFVLFEKIPEVNEDSGGSWSYTDLSGFTAWEGNVVNE